MNDMETLPEWAVCLIQKLRGENSKLRIERRVLREKLEDHRPVSARLKSLAVELEKLERTNV